MYVFIIYLYMYKPPLREVSRREPYVLWIQPDPEPERQQDGARFTILLPYPLDFQSYDQSS